MQLRSAGEDGRALPILLTQISDSDGGAEVQLVSLSATQSIKEQMAGELSWGFLQVHNQTFI